MKIRFCFFDLPYPFSYALYIVSVVLLLATHGVCRPIAFAADIQGRNSMDILSLSVETQDTAVHVNSGFIFNNKRKIASQLHDGAVMTLTCTLRLEQVHTLLPNIVVAETIDTCSMRYDVLTREFTLAIPGKSTLRQRSFSALLDTAFKNIHFILPLRSPLISGENYRLYIDLSLQHAGIPPWLSQALFFWSWDVVPPVSVTQDFHF